jgi:hypothetical protein
MRSPINLEFLSKLNRKIDEKQRKKRVEKKRDEIKSEYDGSEAEIYSTGRGQQHKGKEKDNCVLHDKRLGNEKLRIDLEEDVEEEIQLKRRPRRAKLESTRFICIFILFLIAK